MGQQRSSVDGAVTGDGNALISGSALSSFGAALPQQTIRAMRLELNSMTSSIHRTVAIQRPRSNRSRQR